MNSMKNTIGWYRSQGINIIPLRNREKTPLFAWNEFKKRQATNSEIEEWLAKGIQNFGAICGSVSNDLLVIDVDNQELFSKMGLDGIASKTFTVKTAKGFHIYFRMPDPKKKALVWEGREEIRFQGEGKYVVIVGSRHPTGALYQPLVNSPLRIGRTNSQVLDGVERVWEVYHDIPKLEEKKKVVSSKTKRSPSLESFKRRANLTNVVGRYVNKVNAHGTYWQGHCPFHEDRHPSFTVFEDTKSYYCFGCQRWGDVITFIQEKEGKSFVNAIKRIEEMTGVEFLKKEEGMKVDKKDEERRISPSDVEEIISAERGFATLRDTEEVLHYENTTGGAWRFYGEVLIREEAEKVVKELGKRDKVTRYFTSEVLGHVQRSTYIDRDRLNRETMKINLQNVVYDLESGQLLDHDPGYYFTYLVPVEYREKADCPKIKQFLAEVLHGDDIQTVLQFIGYCLLPIIPYHQAMMFVGDGANGKSTLIELIRRFLGEKNTSSHPLQSITDERFPRADLYGKLANLYSDLATKSMRDTGMFKVLTGGDTLMAERKFKDTFTFKNTTKLIFSANALPYTEDETDAFYRRWLIINFPNQFEGEKCNPRILEELTTPEELSGLLNLVLPALKHLLKDGKFYGSKLIPERRKEYIDKSNPVKSFVENCLEHDPNSFMPKDELYSVFIEFCEERKLPEVAKNVFGARLPRYTPVKAERKKIQGNRVQCWRGIRLKEKQDEAIAQTYACKGCGATFKDFIELNKHKAKCGDFQRMQANETNGRRDG